MHHRKGMMGHHRKGMMGHHRKGMMGHHRKGMMGHHRKGMMGHHRKGMMGQEDLPAGRRWKRWRTMSGAPYPRYGSHAVNGSSATECPGIARRSVADHAFT